MFNTIGVIGLGVMGSNIALNMANKGEKVAVYNYTRDLTDQLVAELDGQSIHPYYEIQDFVQSLETPRKIFLMVTAGKPIDSVITSLLPHLESGDIIMDGGNSHYEDTERRYDELKSKGFSYVGIGISGGEVGALKGPSIMPGGDKDAYEKVAPILTKIAAKVNDAPCCTYIGPKGAGHFVKMVHNGIEYADMQLIAEAYTFLREKLHLEVNEIADIFETWNQGELKSYLIEITAEILRKKDEVTGLPLIDVILDKAGQKGTGKWTSMQAIDNGIPASIITESLFARYISALKEERVHAENILTGPDNVQQKLDKNEWIDYIRQALYMGKVCAYAQGFTQYKMSSELNGWDLPLKDIALIFRGGCIIRAEFLNVISEAYQEQPNLANLLISPYFAEKVAKYQVGLRKVVCEGINSGISFPCLGSSLTYYDSYRTGISNANLLQAQRDYFGAHTYERRDLAGVFHTNWQ
ncbi:decarboxylating NADP(+)-dependent phosphogluconate dehydrogenase [Peribacillus frigoritolerans]|jgi:6-phosphogluconate dehydrogenase|uniref:decarboxylating NADP(+)-dependent phosphogluconate dehydrogenase n=1 Tax=Peribacillus frigoritolerans TaxID=450367 RepID=UPI0006AC9F24|nr:decarboxylating NADP(+)-dependent phosphogluconate dehydrogenase [Peribacillus frigoritolerans]KOR77141.1 6-phosphogluconate dehydrogenase [Bacillus sp. FJAT-21352]AZV61607.1 phosphogluconate dehydrogenase (NADP(+)-dependent, decarboxylating) [Peribacillus frigoritolerans]MDM5311217.1 decarboxylating NADP(+)-dependent phosphogluconate dehydrogenase [Peribacillus frigoritolerans]UZD47311.1 decarboxylating NADP(+)-dependent phosphogluconate dehydrogenase [Peribacillus frigoritolerans]WHX62410